MSSRLFGLDTNPPKTCDHKSAFTRMDIVTEMFVSLKNGIPHVDMTMCPRLAIYATENHMSIDEAVRKIVTGAVDMTRDRLSITKIRQLALVAHIYADGCEIYFMVHGIER